MAQRQPVYGPNIPCTLVEWEYYVALKTTREHTENQANKARRTIEEADRDLKEAARKVKEAECRKRQRMEELRVLKRQKTRQDKELTTIEAAW